MLHLPDVSEFQPNVEFAQVARRNGGAAIVRAMYGTDHVDNAWRDGARRREAHGGGIRALGIYQYLVKDQDAVLQAEKFVSLVGHLRPASSRWSISRRATATRRRARMRGFSTWMRS